jgi:hypothetical protein
MLFLTKTWSGELLRVGVNMERGWKQRGDGGREENGSGKGKRLEEWSWRGKEL